MKLQIVKAFWCILPSPLSILRVKIPARMVGFTEHVPVNTKNHSFPLKKSIGATLSLKPLDILRLNLMMKLAAIRSM